MALNSGITLPAGDSASAQILAARVAAKVKFETEKTSTKVRAANAMMAAGSFREALSLYEPILDDADEGCEQDISVYLNCASCYEHLEDWESLLDASTELLENDKQLCEAYRIGGLALFKKGNLEESQLILKAGLKTCQENREKKLVILELLNEVDEALVLKSKEEIKKYKEETKDALEASYGAPPVLQATMSVVSEFNCCICLETMNDPTSLPCGHSACLGCMRGYFDSAHRGTECPSCRSPVPANNRSNLKVNIGLKVLSILFIRSTMFIGSILIFTMNYRII